MLFDVRRGAAATALLLALGGTAACGSNDAPATAGHNEADTGSITAASAVLTKTTFASKMSDAIQKYHSTHLNLSIGSAVTAVGDVAYQGSAPLMQLAMTFSGQKAELRFVDDTAYLSIPGLTPAGKFLAVKPDNAMMGSLVNELKSFGPDGAISMLRGSVKGFQDLGTTTIDGRQVRHYRITVDPATMAKSLQLPAGVPTTSLPRSVTEDLYVDSRNLLRRAVLDAAGQKVTIDATKWGEPVHVTAPPKSDVVKSPSGLPGMLSGNRAPGA
jgi:hypothetical protein